MMNVAAVQIHSKENQKVAKGELQKRERRIKVVITFTAPESESEITRRYISLVTTQSGK